MDRIQKTEKEIERLHQRKEMYWHQQSPVAWLKLSDRNTSFFHSKATIRKTKNSIEKLKMTTGFGEEVKRRLFR